MAAPDKLRIPYEEFDGARFTCVGQYGNGNQFMAFITGAFPGREHYPDANSNWREKKRWVAVVHQFDADGNHIRSEARVGGFDVEGRAAAGEKASHHLVQMLRELGLESVRASDIYVRPFTTELNGVTYELVYERHVDEGRQVEYMMLWPNDIMFHPPWDSGAYST